MERGALVLAFGLFLRMKGNSPGNGHFPSFYTYGRDLARTSARTHDVMTRCTPSIVIPAEIIQNLIMNQNFQVPRRQVHRDGGRGRPGERVLGGRAADRGARPGPQVVGQRRRLRLVQHELRRRP